MKELSLNLLDIAQNSVKAGASLVTLEVTNSMQHDRVILSVTDDGCGMDKAFLERVTDPFVTSRTTRNVGMGIPLIKLACEMAGGNLSIKSEVGVGTELVAAFVRSHIDRPPLGDICGTVVTLIQGSPSIDIRFIYRTDKGSFELATSELRDTLDGVLLNEPEVLVWIEGFIKENMDEL